MIMLNKDTDRGDFHTQSEVLTKRPWELKSEGNFRAVT